jgi:glycosyltransferase involved in cell wall biosynthesis
MDALSRRGARIHCIVNGWENFRITPMAEEIGATWSVGPYLVHDHRAASDAAQDCAKMAWEILRVSADLLEGSRESVRRTFCPGFPDRLAQRTALALAARARHRRRPRAAERSRTGHVLSSAVAVGGQPAHRSLRVQLGIHTARAARARRAHDKVSTIPNAASTRKERWQRAVRECPGRFIYVGQIIPEKGLDVLLDAVAILREEGVAATLDVVGDMDGWEPPSFAGYRARLRERANGPGPLKGR